MICAYYLTSRINSWAPENKNKTNKNLNQSQAAWQGLFYCLPTVGMALLWDVRSRSSVTLWFYSLITLFLPMGWVGGALSMSSLHVTKFVLTLLLSSLWMTLFVKLIGMPCGRDAMQKNKKHTIIIVLHNWPVPRDARLPLAQEQTLLLGRSCESRAQGIWEVALSSTPVPRGWPLPQLW